MPSVSDTPSEILLLTGPAGVGKSTLSWEISAQLRQAEIPHVVLDSDELDRAWPLSPSEREALNQANLAAFWTNASALGHHRLILTGVFLHSHDDRTWIEAAIPGATVTTIVLDASDQELERRIRSREIGAELDEQLTHPLKQSRRFRRRNTAPHGVLNTDALSLSQLARQAIKQIGWT
jgi:predicted ABC-type ATPase